MVGEDFKIIFAGLDQAGKTTIYKKTMEEMSVNEVQDLRPTRGIERHVHDFLDVDFAVWDLGGQKNYRETYLSKPEVFNQCKALIFVVDIQDEPRLEEAYEYYVAILRILVNVDPIPKIYVLFHKFDPELRGKLRAIFYKATRMFRKADNILNSKFKGYATSIYSNGLDLAVKRILFENFEQFKNLDPQTLTTATPAKLKVGEKTKSKIPTMDRPTQKISTLPKPEEKVPAIPKPEEKVPAIPKPEEKVPTIPKPEEKVKEKEIDIDKEIDKEIDKATPSFFDDISQEVVERLTAVINKRMKNSPEIAALSILSSEGKQVLAIGKTEIDYERLKILKDVVASLNPKKFFKNLSEIEYRGLGHFPLQDFDIYFAKGSDEYAVAIIATDVSTLMLQNAQRIVRSIRQGLGTVADDSSDDSDLDEPTKKPKTKKKDLVNDLRNRLKSISGLDNL